MFLQVTLIFLFPGWMGRWGGPSLCTGFRVGRVWAGLTPWHPHHHHHQGVSIRYYQWSQCPYWVSGVTSAVSVWWPCYHHHHHNHVIMPGPEEELPRSHSLLSLQHQRRGSGSGNIRSQSDSLFYCGKLWGTRQTSILRTAISVWWRFWAIIAWLKGVFYPKRKGRKGSMYLHWFL